MELPCKAQGWLCFNDPGSGGLTKPGKEFKPQPWAQGMQDVRAWQKSQGEDGTDRDNSGTEISSEWEKGICDPDPGEHNPNQRNAERGTHQPGTGSLTSSDRMLIN